MLDNTIGTILPLSPGVNKKCKVCKKIQATYEHILSKNYYMVNKPLICDGCLQSCVYFSNIYIVEFSMPNIFKLYCLFKQTDVFKNLVNDINYHIFYMMIQ